MMVKLLHSVIDKVYRMANLVEASRKVCANKGAPGVDKVTVTVWQAKEATYLRQLHGELYADNYRSKHVRWKYIPKRGSKKMRPLGIPAVKDRVCQQAVLNILQPVFEGIFFAGSHGFRPGRSNPDSAASYPWLPQGWISLCGGPGHPQLLRGSGPHASDEAGARGGQRPLGAGAHPGLADCGDTGGRRDVGFSHRYKDYSCDFCQKGCALMTPKVRKRGLHLAEVAVGVVLIGLLSTLLRFHV